MADPIPLHPEPPRRPASPEPRGPTMPCPGCGWPVPADGLLCTRCGQRRRGDARLETRVDKPEQLGPLPPAVGSMRWRNERLDDWSLRREMLKPAIWLGVGLVITLALRAHMPGPEDVLPHVARTGILFGGCLAVWVFARLIFLDQEVTLPTIIVGIAAALAVSDGAQHIVRYATPVALTAWPIGLVLCVGVLSDSIDADVADAAILGVFFYLLKIVLKFTLFTEFLTPP